MFLQKLWRKLSEFLKKTNIMDIIIHSYRELMIALAIVGALIVIIVLFISLIIPRDRKTTSSTLPLTHDAENASVYEKKILSIDDVIYPAVKGFDVSSDYHDFYPILSTEPPNLTTLDISDYVEESLQNDLLLPFEKRKATRTSPEK